MRIFKLTAALLVLGAITASAKVSAQELKTENLGCTRNLRTSVLGQSAPDYCTSADADSGLLIDDFNENRQVDGSIKLNMKVFNRGSADAFVEVYNSSGKLVDIEIIKGNKPPTGLVQSGYDLFTKVPASLFSKYPLDDARRNLEEQDVSIKIPAGGSVKITKSSKKALAYNTVLLVLEISQLKDGDSEFLKSESVKKFVLDFAKDVNNEALFNIFKSVTTQKGIFSLDFIDPRKSAELLQELLQYSLEVKDSPILEAFKDINLTATNITIETFLDKYILPGLGTLAREARRGGNTLNTLARAGDLQFATKSGEKATITLRNTVSPRTNASNTTTYYSPPITFKLGASEGCINTGINVSKNQVIKFSATGEASYGYEGSPVNAYPTTNPNGDRLVNGVNIGAKNDPNAIYPGPIGALVGKIDSSHHSGNYFLIGSNNQISMAKSGRLIVCYNEVDGQLGNNTGFYTVSIYRQIVSGSSSKSSSSASSTVTSRNPASRRRNSYNTSSYLDQQSAANVALRSEMGIDYTRLRNLLAAQQWKEANNETLNIVLRATGQQQVGFSTAHSIQRFSCTDLRTIDQLWLKYSKGHFGLSLQKKLWESVGGRLNETAWYVSANYALFAHKVGWKATFDYAYKDYLSYDNLSFKTLAPRGHLPAARYRGRPSLLTSFERTAACKL